jgi:hypothetical protein
MGADLAVVPAALTRRIHDMIAHKELLAMSGLVLLIAGCASKVERPVEEMTRATTLIEQAEKAGAQRHAAAELQQARDKLAQAEKAANDGKGDVALRLAMEATVDAELANARTASGEAQSAAEELHRSTESLRREAERSSTSPALPPNGTSR